jgi:hypothetical protein
MYNYAKNYRNWTPQHRPQKRYRDSYLHIRDSEAHDGNQADSYLPSGDSQKHDGNHADSDYNEYEDSATESRPFGNEIDAIDYYANKYRNYDRYDRRKSNIRNRDSQNEYVSRHSYQSDNAAVESRVKGYSTLPDEINTPSLSGGHDFQYTSAADQDFRAFKNQNPSDAQGVRVFKNHNSGHGQDFRLNNQNFGDGQEFRFKNQNQNSGNKQELQFNAQNFPVVRATQFGGHTFGNGQRPAGRDDLRYNTQNVGGTNEFQYNTQTSQTGQESRLRNQNIWGEHDLRYNTQNSAGRYNDQNSASGVHGSETGFPVSHGHPNNNRPHRETEHNFGEVVNSHPTPEDLYYKAFRSFSFRKNPSPSSSKGQLDSFSGASFNNKHAPHTSPSHQSGTAHSDRENNQWFNGRTGPNKDHDIGFFEGLEDINDGAGI